MADLDIVCVLVSILDTIIYYRQCIDLPANIIPNVDDTDQKHDERQTNPPQNKEDQLPLDAYALLNISHNARSTAKIVATSSVYIHNVSIDQSTDDIYKLCCKTEHPLTVSILIKYCSAGNTDQSQQLHLIDSQISPILQSIQYQIHKFFMSSKQIPIYILRIRCHTLVQKELTSYQSSQGNKYTIQCCGKADSSLDMAKLQLEMAIYHHKPELPRSHSNDRMRLQADSDTRHVPSNWGGGFIMMYNITSRLSFQDVQDCHYRLISGALYHNEAKPVLILVANKCDLKEYRQVSTKEGQKLANQWDVPFIQTSAKDRINHIYCFEAMGREIIRTIFEDPADAVMLNANGAIPEFNIFMKGPGAVGKTSITIVFLCGVFSSEYEPTIEDFYRKEIIVDGHRVVLNIYDTAGQEEFSHERIMVTFTECPRIRARWNDKEATRSDKDKPEPHPHAQTKLIDNVFADLENMFYLLSDLVYLGMNKGRNICIYVLKLVLEILVIYPLVVIISVLMVLPSCFFLLFVRMNKIESDVQQVAVRQAIIESEKCMQRLCRIVSQCIRSVFMLCLLVVTPVIITYVIIPNTSNGVDVVVIGVYLCLILLLQVFGTYRGLKSFEAKKKETVNSETGDKTEFKAQTFKWNLGSLIAVIMLIWELLQMSLFVYHTSKGEQTENAAAEETEPLIQIDNERFIELNHQMKHFVEKISYISFNIASSISLADYYMIFSIIFVGLLLSFFMFRFVFELRTYAHIKRAKNDIEGSRNFYFHSFIGTIVYGHGTLKNVNPFAAKIISLLSDTLFLGICEKLILLLLCTKSKADDMYYMTLDPDIQCWSGKHQLYATLSLILIGYYIPMCTMIAPMFDDVPGNEDEEQEELEEENGHQKQETKGFCCCKKTVMAEDVEESKEEEETSKMKQFFSFDNDVDFVRPFVSAITVSKCFMLIFATYVFSGGVVSTIVCQSISCVVLMVFTLYWSFSNLYLYGLTQNEPGFPFGICLIRVLGFFCGICGCVVEILKYNHIIHSNLDFLALATTMIIASIIIGIVFVKYYTKFNKMDDNIDPYLAVTFDEDTKTLKLIHLESSKDDAAQKDIEE
eukprot:119504_1